MAAATESTIETQHTDAVHDSQFDYYGRFLATCSSDRTIRLFAVAAGENQLAAVLTGHDGPVWMVAWAHPKFGNALASASFDGKAIVWKEGPVGSWKPSHIITAHSGSVNAVAWAPHEAGAAVATVGSDGNVCITTCSGAWRESVTLREPSTAEPRPAHLMGAMGVSFAPMQSDSPAVVLASCGSDSSVKLWVSSGPSLSSATPPSWRLGRKFTDHKDWVRDVAFSPDAGSRYVTLASCSQDKSVIVRRCLRGKEDSDEWEVSKPAVFPDVVFRLSWSPCGTSLLATTGDSLAFVLTQGPVFGDEWIRAPVTAVDGDLKASS